MQYKGYKARVEFDQDAGVLFGEVDGLRDVVTFEATDVKGLERAFRESVEDYLAMCAEKGEEPEKPYSGKFLVRVDPVIHREIATAAGRAGKSLNSFLGELLRNWVEGAHTKPAAGRLPGPNARSRERPVEVFDLEPKPTPGEATSMPENPNFWQGQYQNRPSSRTPNTPGGSLTPQPLAA